jgi:hypothetical protein
MENELSELRTLCHALADMALQMQATIAEQRATIDALIGTLGLTTPQALPTLRDALLMRIESAAQEVPDESRAHFQSLVAGRLQGIDALLGR